MQRLQRDHTGHHIGRHTRPAPTRREQIGEHLIGKQFSPMRRQERKNTARLEKMTGYRLRIQQLTLIIRSTLHTEIIPKNQHTKADRRAGLFRAFLGVVVKLVRDNRELIRTSALFALPGRCSAPSLPALQR